MTARDEVLAALQGGTRRSQEPLEPLTHREPGAPANLDELWDRFAAMLSAVGGRLASEDDLRKALVGQTWIDDDAGSLLPGIVGGAKATVPIDMWEAEAGITTADLAIAETGSLLLSAGSGKTRMASLAPPLHIALVRRSDIVATLEEGIARLGDRTSVLITGPSRTADIEGVLIRGVHGPGELLVFVH